MFIIIIMRKREEKVEEADGMYTFNQERERERRKRERASTDNERRMKDRRHTQYAATSLGLLYVCDIFDTFNRCC